MYCKGEYCKVLCKPIFKECCWVHKDSLNQVNLIANIIFFENAVLFKTEHCSALSQRTSQSHLRLKPDHSTCDCSAILAKSWT